VDTRRILLWLIIVMVLVVYRTRSRLNVTPDAEREIEKAKRR
jgi:hypothetical protein